MNVSSNIIPYISSDGTTKLSVLLESETVCLNQEQDEGLCLRDDFTFLGQHPLRSDFFPSHVTLRIVA